MATIFSETLTHLRKEAGFPTAYKFYHSNGGAQGLKLSYRKYLAMEQGKILPVVGRLSLLLPGLHILPKSPTGNKLITAWLKTMAGEEAFKDIFEPLLIPPTTQPHISPMHKAMRTALTDEKYHMTSQQLAVIAGNLGNYTCFMLMSNDTGHWSAKKLSSLAGLTENTTEKTLKALADVKVLKRTRAGHYKCPMATAMIEYPSYTPATKAALQTIRGYQDELAAAGTHAWHRRGLIRADSDALCDFFPIMALNLSTAHSYAITEGTKKSALYSIEGRVIKLRDF
ncbi:MAG TPA: hypothetical protein DEQ38_11745 [Elusimicrobia bacterium]|nr:hypothetical protein [Elusimicrobiota bacterium]